MSVETDGSKVEEVNDEEDVELEEKEGRRQDAERSQVRKNWKTTR